MYGNVNDIVIKWNNSKSISISK